MRGTDRDDLAVREALKANGFKWSRNQQFWYLPRPWGYERRTSHVRRLLEALHGLGRPVHVEDAQPLPRRELEQARDQVPQLAEDLGTLAQEQAEQIPAPEYTPKANEQTPEAREGQTGVPHDTGGKPIDDDTIPHTIPYTHWGYFEDPDAAQRCADELTRLDFLCGVDPSQADPDRWVLRAAREIPLGDGWSERQEMVEAIMVRHGGICDGGESGWLNLETGDYVRQAEPDLGID